jgi:hypothetical protein
MLLLSPTLVRPPVADNIYESYGDSVSSNIGLLIWSSAVVSSPLSPPKTARGARDIFGPWHDDLNFTNRRFFP